MYCMRSVLHIAQIDRGEPLDRRNSKHLQNCTLNASKLWQVIRNLELRLCNSSVLLFSLNISTFIMMRNAIALILEFFLQKWLNGITAWIKNLSWPSWKFQLTHLIFSRAAKWAIAEFAGNRPYPQAILGNFPRPRAKPSVSENFPNCLRMRAISYTNFSKKIVTIVDYV